MLSRTVSSTQNAVRIHTIPDFHKRLYLLCRLSLRNDRGINSLTYRLLNCPLFQSQDNLCIGQGGFSLSLQLTDEFRQVSDGAIEISLTLGFQILELVLECSEFPRYPAFFPCQAFCQFPCLLNPAHCPRQVRSRPRLVLQ